MGMGTLPSNIMNNTPHEMVMAIIGNQLFNLVITSQIPHSQPQIAQHNSLFIGQDCIYQII